MNPLEQFHRIAGMPLSQWRDRFPGQRPMGIYNAYVPEELFQAAGFAPVYLFHRSGDRGHARVHLPSFACWPGRSLIDQAMAGDLDGLAGIALAQTCDMVQALTDIWRSVAPGVPVYHVGIPTNLTARASSSYLVAELNQLRRALGDLSDDAIRQACAAYNRTRDLVAGLYARAADLLPTDLYVALRAGFLMPKEEYNEMLAKLLDDLPRSKSSGPRLMLVGPHLADPALYQIIEDAGGRVVDDVLDIGHRYFADPVAMDRDPITALADRIAAILPTPTKHHAAHRRNVYLLEQITQHSADGIVFARQKFCDPHGFDYANLRSTLARRGVPHLLLELEQSTQTEQMRTRIEAFFETLAHR